MLTSKSCTANDSGLSKIAVIWFTHPSNIQHGTPDTCKYNDITCIQVNQLSLVTSSMAPLTPANMMTLPVYNSITHSAEQHPAWHTWHLQTHWHYLYTSQSLTQPSNIQHGTPDTCKYNDSTCIQVNQLTQPSNIQHGTPDTCIYDDTTCTQVNHSLSPVTSSTAHLTPANIMTLPAHKSITHSA